MVPESTEGLDALVPNLRVERFEGATHWIQHDEPERVNEMLIDFLSREAGRR